MNRENFKVYKAVIIGGGMAGLVSATLLSKKFGGENIAIIERLNRVGKKILSTGNGWCNLTNENITISNYHGNDVEFANCAINNFNKESLITFFESLGVKLIKENDKYYPLSKQASSVLDSLRFCLDYNKVNVFVDQKVIKVKKDKYFNVITENGGSYYAENVIVAVGGKSAKHLGTDGSSYNILTDFGHKITKLYPSLVQLKCEKEGIKGLKGIKAQVSLYAKTDKITSPKFNGDLLFTDYGVSGNAVFSVSSYIAGQNNSKIYVDFCPCMINNELSEFIENKIINCPYLTCENLLSGIIPNKIAQRLFLNNGIPLDTSVKDINVTKVVGFIKNTEYKIVGDTGFDNSQVTHGGILTDDFNDRTMQSKLVKGLYAVGEVLDIDGDCGGYNLQWAYSSAMLACKDIK